MSQDINIRITSTNKILSSSGDTTAGYLDSELTGTTGNILISTVDIGGGNTISKVDIGANVFNKSTNTTDDISSGTTNFFLDNNQNAAADNADNPSALNPFLTESAALGLFTTGVSWNWNGARDSNGGSDRDMRANSVLLNNTPFIIPVDCYLKYIAASTDGTETWDAHIYKNGISIGFLPLSGVSSLVSSELSISFQKGDEVRLRQENATGQILRPRISVFFREI